MKAQEALKNLDEIEDMVNEAITKANETQYVLSDAERNAIDAKNIAVDAQVCVSANKLLNLENFASPIHHVFIVIL